MVPAPVVDQAKAREAVTIVIKDFANHRCGQEGAWESWEEAFEADDHAGLEAVWDRSGEREGVVGKLRDLWTSRIGRNWKDGEEGESVAVEFECVSP